MHSTVRHKCILSAREGGYLPPFQCIPGTGRGCTRWSRSSHELRLEAFEWEALLGSESRGPEAWASEPESDGGKERSGAEIIAWASEERMAGGGCGDWDVPLGSPGGE